MKKTNDPLKKVQTNKAAADATGVKVNLPVGVKSPKEKIGNIPYRLAEKQEENHRFLVEHGYTPIKNDRGEITEYRLNKGYENLSQKGKEDFVKGTKEFYNKVDKSKDVIKNKKAVDEYQKNHPAPTPSTYKDRYGNIVYRNK
jgi:hypothetical protein